MASQEFMHAVNPVYEYKFSWKIDSFYFISNTSLKVQGPTFLPFRGLQSKFCFELVFRKVTELISDPDDPSFCIDCESEDCNCTQCVDYLDVRLIDLNNRDLSVPLYVVSTIKLRENDQILCTHISGVTIVEQATTLTSYRESEMPVNYCQFTMEGKLRFSGLWIKSTIHPRLEAMKNRSDLSKDLKTMYERGYGSDITFSFGEKKLRAHRAILSCRSPVFARMFEHDMLENVTNNVAIEDIDCHTFNCFLVFLYSGDLQYDGYESMISLYSVAQKYQVMILQKTCSALLVNHLDFNSCCSVLVLADLHGDEELKGAVKIFIRENFVHVAGTTTWGELLTTNPTLAHECVDCIKSIDDGNVP